MDALQGTLTRYCGVVQFELATLMSGVAKVALHSACKTLESIMSADALSFLGFLIVNLV